MKDRNLLNENYVYIEFGAGRGRFTHEVATFNKDLSAHILLGIK
jgi:hypothetical protein